MKYVLIGADGQLGTDILKVMPPQQSLPLYFPDFDITQFKDVEEILEKWNPEFVINTAAYNRVDVSENNPQEAFQINSTAVDNLARICRKTATTLIHFSTDYVFDGKKGSPYSEEDAPHPLNVYGLSKLEGEDSIRRQLEHYFIIRTCGLYGAAGCWGKGYNFVDAMIKAAKAGETVSIVGDQVVSPTSTAELAMRVFELIARGKPGLYHMANEGRCTWFEFAQTIFSLFGRPVKTIKVDSATYKTSAVRPSFSALDCTKAKKAGVTPFSGWEKALEDYMKIKGYVS